MRSLFDLVNKPTFLFDSHAHINSADYDSNIDAVVSRSKDNGVELICDVGITIESSQKSLELSRKYEDKVKSFVGIDPEVFIPGGHFFIGLDKGESWFEQQYNAIEQLIADNRELITGIGETGMDFYWLKSLDASMDSPPGRGLRGGTTSKLLQEQLFQLHIQLAKKYDLPLTIHSRGAERECLDIMKKSETLGIFHSYTGDYETAVKILDIGCGLGVNGIVTFKNAENLRIMYRKILGKVSNDWEPSDFYKKGIFFETDAPFLAPDGKRGDRNEPANVRIVYERFVELMG